MSLNSRQEPVNRSSIAIAGISVVLGVVLAGLDYYLHPPLATAGMVLAVAVTGLLYARLLGWQVGLLVLLIVTCFIDRYTFAVSTLSLRPEQVGALFGVIVVANFRLRAAWTLSSMRPNLAEWALLAWFAVGLLSSLAFAPARTQSVKILALLLISAMAMFLPRRVLEDSAVRLDQMVRYLLLAFAVESAYALFAYFLHLAGPIVSLSVNPAGGHLNGYGTLWEPNVLGAICGAGAVAWRYLGGRYFPLPWIGIALCLSASVISFSRAAWLAVVIVMVFGFLFSSRRMIAIRALGIGVAIALIIVAGVLVADRSGSYYQKLSPPVTTGGPPASAPSGSGRLFGTLLNGVDVLGRLYQFETAFGDLKDSPLHILLGGGVDSYGERHTSAGLPQHIANLELTILNDTGVIGLLVFAAVAFLIATEAWRLRSDPRVAGLSAMVLVIAITNVSTQTLELMITWLLVGVLLAATQVARSVSGSAETARTVRDIAL